MAKATTENAKRLAAVKRDFEQSSLRQWLARNGLPAPTFEYQFEISRKWRFDVVWIAQKVALEIEGSVWKQGRHTRGGGFLDDAAKYGSAASQGWLVFRVARPPQARRHVAVLFHPEVVRWLRSAINRLPI